MPKKRPHDEFRKLQRLVKKIHPEATLVHDVPSNSYKLDLPAGYVLAGLGLHYLDQSYWDYGAHTDAEAKLGVLAMMREEIEDAIAFGGVEPCPDEPHCDICDEIRADEDDAYY